MTLAAVIIGLTMAAIFAAVGISTLLNEAFDNEKRKQAEIPL